MVILTFEKKNYLKLYKLHPTLLKNATRNSVAFSLFSELLLSHRSVSYLQGNVHIAALAFDVVGIKGFWVTALENMALATNLTFGLLLSRLGITQVNKASPLTAPSVHNYAGISRHRGHRPDALPWWNFLSSEVA